MALFEKSYSLRLGHAQGRRVHRTLLCTFAPLRYKNFIEKFIAKKQKWQEFFDSCHSIFH